MQLTHFNFDEHTAPLWHALGGEKVNELIRFFPNGPYETSTEFGNWLKEVNESKAFHTMIISSLKTQESLGMASYMRCAPEHGSVEIGAIAHGPKMMRSPMATEAHYLLAKHIFDDLGYSEAPFVIGGFDLFGQKPFAIDFSDSRIFVGRAD